MIIPENLKKGDVVVLVAPSGKIDSQALDFTEKILNSWGLVVRRSAHVSGEFNIFSADTNGRLNDLQTAFDDPEVKAIFCARGGYGAIQFIDKLNLKGIISNPKWLVGFSDITILHSVLNRSGIATIHGPMAINFEPLSSNADDDSIDYLRQLLFEGITNYAWQGKSNTPEASVSGELVGGNLSVLAGLRGTLYEPNYYGKILFIEDLNEQLYHVDRMIHNLKLGGIFNRVNAVLIGGFTMMNDSEPPFGSTVEEIILDATKDFDIPVIFGFDAGHQSPNYALPMGVTLNLTCKNDLCSISVSSILD
jgi:muramoyltetrapeptide carboxypeptidase